eukprot:Skav212843  [mRNA]  locus=scaffold325:98454:116739:+ [translate_table: standard]
MEYLDSDDLTRKNWSAGRGNMIAGLKTKVTDGVVAITGITKKPVNQSGKTEQPSDRLTLVSLSRAPGDADSYEQVVGGTGTQAGPEASESFVGCEIFDGTVAPDGFQAPEQRLPTVDDSVLQGAEGFVWQVTLSVDAAGRIQGDGHPIKRKKNILHGRKNSTTVVEPVEPVEEDSELPSECPDDDVPESPSGKKKKSRRGRPVMEEDEECEEDSDPGDFNEEEEEARHDPSKQPKASHMMQCQTFESCQELTLHRGETEECSEEGSDGSGRREVDRSTLSEELQPLYDCIAELTESLEKLQATLRNLPKCPEGQEAPQGELSDFFEELYGEDYDSEYDSSDDEEEPPEAGWAHWKREEYDEDEEEEEQPPTTETTALLKGEWRAANPHDDDPELEGLKMEGRWSAMRVVDESARLVGLWRVSVGLQDGAQATGGDVHFAVESRSGAVNGVLLEGPDLDSATGEGPKAAPGPWESLKGRKGSRAVFRVISRDSQQPKLGRDPGEEHSPLRFSAYPVNGWKGRAMLEGQLDRKGGAVASITGERCGREVSGSHWWCNRLLPTKEEVDEDERRQLEVAALDRFKLAGKDLGTFALMSSGVCRHNGKDEGQSAAWKDGVLISVAVDCDAGTVQWCPQLAPLGGVATLDKPAFETVLQLSAEEMPAEAKEFHPLAELMELRRQWRVKPSRQAEGSESLQAQWGFEELGMQDESLGLEWCEVDSPQWWMVAGFKFFRFVVTKARGGDTVNGVALGQLLLRREGTELDLAEATAENPDGQFADTEGPSNAIDGRTSTRWHSTVLSPLVIKLPKPVLIDSFSFRTGPSDEQLDPVEWRLEASNDQNTWKETSYHPPRRRCGQASWFDTSTKGSGSSGKNKLAGA